MAATFQHTTIYILTYQDRDFYYYYVDGIEVAITAVEFARLAAAGARIMRSA